LIPFYQLHRQRYSVYWKLLSTTEWKAQTAELAAAEASRVAEEAHVVDSVSPGEQQSETDHKLQGGDTQSGDFDGRKWRHASDWFSYEVKVLPDQPVQLVCTFWGGDAGGREFDVVVDGNIVATEKLNNNRPGEFYDAAYAPPAELVGGKDKVTVKFSAHPGNLAGGIYGVRTTIPHAPAASISALNLAAVATPSASNVSGDTSLAALNDGYTPRNSRDNRRGSYGNWPSTGTQWVEYDWSQPISTKQI